MGICVGVSKSAICRAESENDSYFLPDDILEKYSQKFHKPLFYWKGEEPTDEISKLKDHIYKLEEDILKQTDTVNETITKLTNLKKDLEKLEKDYRK